MSLQRSSYLLDAEWSLADNNLSHHIGALFGSFRGFSEQRFLTSVSCTKHLMQHPDLSTSVKQNSCLVVTVCPA